MSSIKQAASTLVGLLLAFCSDGLSHGVAGQQTQEAVLFRWAQNPSLMLSASYEETTEASIDNAVYLEEYRAGDVLTTALWRVNTTRAGGNTYYLVSSASLFENVLSLFKTGPFVGGELVGTVNDSSAIATGQQSVWGFTRDDCNPSLFYISPAASNTSTVPLCLAGVEREDSMLVDVQVQSCLVGSLDQLWQLWSASDEEATSPPIFRNNTTGFIILDPSRDCSQKYESLQLPTTPSFFQRPPSPKRRHRPPPAPSSPQDLYPPYSDFPPPLNDGPPGPPAFMPTIQLPPSVYMPYPPHSDLPPAFMPRPPPTNGTHPQTPYPSPFILAPPPFPPPLSICQVVSINEVISSTIITTYRTLCGMNISGHHNCDTTAHIHVNASDYKTVTTQWSELC